MTREEELDWLCRLRSEIYVYMPKEWLIPMNNALDMAIKALQEPSGETVSLEAFKQVKWERDIAIEQLKELGYGFGQKIESSGDAISRQATIEAFQMFRGYEANRTNAEWVDRIETIVKKLPSVNPQVSCGDAISRQAVLDAIEDDNRNGMWSCFVSDDDAQKFKTVIKDLPSVKQEPKTEQEDDYFRKIVEVAISQLRADRDRLEDELAKREREPCDNAVSRQAVLDAMYELCNTGETLEENPWRDNPHIDAITDAINNLVPVNPQEPSSSENPNKWIPVSERLPEKGQRVLASQTIEYGHRVEITQYDRFGFLLGIVDAWMPLPEPYKAERSDKE